MSSWRRRCLDAFAFTVPSLQFLEISFVGRLFVTELILLAVLPFLAASSSRDLRNRNYVILLLLLLAWLFSQVITDVVRRSGLNDYARGWALIVLTIGNFTALFILLRKNESRQLCYLLGLAFGSVGAYLLNPGVYAESMPWKFGYGWAATTITMLFVHRRWRRRRVFDPWCAVIMIAVAGTNMVLGFRSLAGICFIALLLICARELRVVRALNARYTLPRVLLFLTLAMASVASVVTLYETTVSSGVLGEEAKQKYEEQSVGSPGILIGGRSEILGYSAAIIDSPVIGHGSWARNCDYVGIYAARRHDLGYTDIGLEDCLIPTHSHLFGAWVHSGILGAVFWAYVLWLALAGIRRSIVAPQVSGPVHIYVLVLLIWDVLFSPYGAERRFIEPFYIIILLSLLRQTRRSYKG